MVPLVSPADILQNMSNTNVFSIAGGGKARIASSAPVEISLGRVTFVIKIRRFCYHLAHLSNEPLLVFVRGGIAIIIWLISQIERSLPNL